MGISLLEYSATSAKTRAMFSKLLTNDDYLYLLSRKTVRDVVEYLKKNTAYNKVLLNINENNVHRNELEMVFKESIYDDFNKILRFLSDDSLKFIKASFLRHELEDIKVLLREIYTGRDNEFIIDSLVFLKKHSKIDYKKLFNSKSLNDLIGNLKGTEYYKALSYFSRREEGQNLFDMEMSLDINYFMLIIKLKEKLLSGKDNKLISMSLGMEIDIMNIMFIYRSKKLFNLSKEITLNNVIPFWFRLKKEQLVGLAECNDIQEFKEYVERTPYSKIFRANEEHLWEINSINYLYKFYKSLLRKGQFTLGAIMGYMHLKDIDVRNIITIIEGVRYSLPEDEIKSYIVGKSDKLDKFGK